MDLTQEEIQALHQAIHTHLLKYAEDLAAEPAKMWMELHEKFEQADTRTKGQIHTDVRRLFNRPRQPWERG